MTMPLRWNRKPEDNAKNFQEAIANATGPKSKKDATAPNQPLLDELKASLKEALLVQNETQEAQATATESFFSLYANLLSEDAQFHWDKIVSSQVRAAQWTDLKGKDMRKSVIRVWSLSRIALLSTFLTCSLVMQPSSSATTSVTC
jgi:hypothetical protein